MPVDRNWGEPRILPPTGSHEMDPADVQSFVEGDLPTEAPSHRPLDWKTSAVVKEWKVESEDLDALIASTEQGTEREDLGALVACTVREAGWRRMNDELLADYHRMREERDDARAEVQTVERRAEGVREELDGLLASETHWQEEAVVYQKERNRWKERCEEAEQQVARLKGLLDYSKDLLHEADSAKHLLQGAEENLATAISHSAELAEALGKMMAQRNDAVRLVLQFEEFVAGLKEERDEALERVRELTLDLAAALQDATYHKDRRAIDAARRIKEEPDIWEARANELARQILELKDGMRKLFKERDEARQQSQHWRVHAAGLQETVAELKESLALTSKLLRKCDPSVGYTGLPKGSHQRERDRG